MWCARRRLELRHQPRVPDQRAAEGLGLQASLRDFGCESSVTVKSDATAALGMCKREGLGRVRHLATGDLWVQQLRRHGRLQLAKCPGVDNPSHTL